MKNLLFDKIVPELLSDPYFSEFKFRKRDSRIYMKTKDGQKYISLEHRWQGYDKQGNTIILHPLYFIRFDILHKWFEKYSFKDLRTQLDTWSFGFDGRELKRTDEFEFHNNGYEYAEMFNLFKDTVINCAKKVFNDYGTLTQCFEKEVAPIFAGEKNLFLGGVDWLFDSLVTCRIVSPENYPKLKEMIMHNFDERMKRNEPNIRHYYHRLPEIIADLEATF